jgi:hypothetical protein
MKTPMQELIEEMERSPLMFAPALALIKEKNFLEKKDDVSKQSELLKDFRKWWNEDNQGVCTTITHKDIERYLESL